MNLPFEKFIGILAALCGFFVMGAWFINQEFLRAISLDLIVMTFNTALLFTLAGIALLLPNRLPRLQKNGQIFVGVILIFISFSIFLQDLTGVDFLIDQAVVKVQIDDLNPHPGRIPPQAAIGFMCVGAIFLFLNFLSASWVSGFILFLILLVFIIGVTGLTTASINLDELYDWYKYARMSTPTAAFFSVFSIAFWLKWLDKTEADISIEAEDYFKLEGRRIAIIGSILLIVTAISSGSVGFGLLAGEIQRNMGLSLRNDFDNKVSIILNEIKGGLDNAVDFSILALSKVETQTLSEKDFLSLVGANIQKQDSEDFSAIIVFSDAGKIYAQKGNISDKPEIVAPVRSVLPTVGVELLWHDGGAKLKTTIELKKEGKVLGKLVAEQPMFYLSSIPQEKVALGDSSETRLCFSLNEMQKQCFPTRLHKNIFAVEAMGEGDKATSTDLALQGLSGFRTALDYRGIQTMSAYGPVGTTGLTLVEKVDTDELFEPLQKTLKYTIGLIFFLSALGVLLQKNQLFPLINRVIWSERRLKAVLKGVTDGIVTVNSKGIIESANPAVLRIFGYEMQDTIGKSISFLIPDKENNSVFNSMRDGSSIEIQTTNKNREPIFILAGFTEISVDGEILYVGCLRDVSERKRIEKIKNEFVSTVSHELRTPLTSIRGSLGLILSGVGGGLGEKTRGLIEIAHKNCERLILLINDILDIEKIESGQMHFDLRLHYIDSLLEQAIELNKPYGEKHDVSFHLDAPIPRIKILVDGDRFGQIMSNLLSNAAKFSPEGGGVFIKSEQIGSVIRISVSDHGAGIPKEFQDKIFGKFAQADSSNTKSVGGTGLGLNITKQIVEKMGGKISFDSEAGKGTTFNVDFPAEQTQEKPGKSENEKQRILVCDDNKFVATILKNSIEKQGYEVDLAHDSAEVVSRTKKNSYAAICMDLHLRDKDGFQLIRELREVPETKSTPIIIVSAAAQKEKINGNALEIYNWFTKPVDMRRLLKDIRHVVSGSDKPSILFVEDDIDFANILSDQLQNIATIVHAPTLKLARKNLAAELFDLVIIDVLLPDGSGLDLIESLATDSKNRSPVIILSALEMSREIREKVDACLVKSKITENEITDIVLYYINKERAQI